MWNGRIKAVTKAMFGAGGPGGGDDGTMTRLIEGSRKARRTDPDAVIRKFTGWVYVCAGRNAATVANQELRLFTVGGVSDDAKRWYNAKAISKPHLKYLRSSTRHKGLPEESVELLEHPALELLRLANPKELGFTLREVTTLHQELIGNAYWYLEPFTDPVRAGQPQAIWPLLPNLVKIITDPKGTAVVGYLYGKDPRTQIAYTADEIIHFRYPNPTDSLYGLGPAQAGIMAIHRKESMDEYRAAMYDNNCRPDFAVTVPQDTDPEDIKALYTQWDKRFKVRGTQFKKLGRPWIATEGMKITTLSFKPNQMQDIPQAKLDRDEIYQLFGNPVTMGEISKSRAEAEAGEFAYMKHAIHPRLTRFVQQLNESLAPRFDTRLFFAIDDPVPENTVAKRLDVDMMLTQGLITINEGRRIMNLETIEGGDVIAATAAAALARVGGGEPEKAASFLCQRNAARAGVPVSDVPDS